MRTPYMGVLSLFGGVFSLARTLFLFPSDPDAVGALVRPLRRRVSSVVR